MKRSILSAFALAIGLTLVFTPLAFAHERRTVGKYHIVVGFLNEPAYIYQVNGIDFRVTNTETNKPIEGVEKTVKAEVTVGGKILPLPMATCFGQPGSYAAYIIPTRASAYSFHFSGDIEGTKIDEKFESGPGRFSDIEDTAALQFPEKLGNPAEMNAQVQAALAAAANSQTIAYVGVAFGILGTVLGALGWMKNR